jgi:anaerobic carbon-monoxide dehydrogenase iron sulfur subunit
VRIKVSRDKCTGCRLCLQICGIAHFHEINPRKAALRIEGKFPDPGKYKAVVCTQCGKCAEVCPETAIARDPETGAYIVDRAKCTNCGECVTACPVGVVVQHADHDFVIICDFCMKCTEVCNTGSIVKWERQAGPAAEKEASHG